MAIYSWIRSLFGSTMSVVFYFLVVTFHSSASVAAPSLDSIVGAWSGRYVCSQGATKLDLTISKGNTIGSVGAIFNFSALPENPGVPSGSYEMTGSYDVIQGTLSLQPLRWIVQPPGYAMVGLLGVVEEASQKRTYNGNVTHSSCGAFALTQFRNSPCGDERDLIIEEYKKSYPTSKGPRKPSYVPKCSDFLTASLIRKITRYYSFGELNLGDRKCAKYSHNWGIIAPPLRAPSTTGYGLDRLIERISVGSPTVLHPRANSGYRNPKRNFSTEVGCASSTAGDSAHMYGSAIDLATPGQNNAERKKNAARWNRIAKLEARARFVESKPGYGCSTSSWSCVHADWQNATFGAIGPSQPFIPLEANLMKARPMIVGGIAALATSIATGATGLEAQSSGTIQQWIKSEDWQDRAKAFEALELDLSGSMDLDPLHESQRALAAGKRKLSEPQKQTLHRLLKVEIGYQDNPPKGGIDEGENEYFLKLVEAVGMYGDKATIPLLFEKGVVITGSLAHSAAARTGDKGVNVLAAKMRDQNGEAYADYIGVACLMLRHGTLYEPENRKKVEALLFEAATTEDDLNRSFAATCLQWVPRDKALPVLTRLASGDSSARVRENAREALRTFGTSQ